MGPSRTLVIGDLEATRLVCALLRDEGVDVVHLLEPEEAALRAALERPVAGVAVVVRGDLPALRFALLVEHLQPGVPIVVTIFDRTLGRHLAEVLPRCTVTSPADVAAPAIVAACVRPEVLAVLAGAEGVRELVETDEGVALRASALTRTDGADGSAAGCPAGTVAPRGSSCSGSAGSSRPSASSGSSPRSSSTRGSSRASTPRRDSSRRSVPGRRTCTAPPAGTSGSRGC